MQTEINQMKYTPSQAMQEAEHFLNNCTWADFTDAIEHAKFRTYRSLLNRGKLGQGSLETIYKKMGLIQVVHYIKPEAEGIISDGRKLYKIEDDE